MNFTYSGYKRMVLLLLEHGYEFCDYSSYMKFKKPVIFRHDVDVDLEKCIPIAKLEEEFGVRSTFFVLISSNLYNPFSKDSRKVLETIAKCGHEIGLHFDETLYNDGIPDFLTDDLISRIISESEILSTIIEKPVGVVSMHIPSKRTLEMNLKIPGIINSYGEEFFHEFKYLSDSHMCWREPVLDIIREEQFDKLHILTHPIWYDEIENSIEIIVRDYVHKGKMFRENNIKEIVPKLNVSEICS